MPDTVDTLPEGTATILITDVVGSTEMGSQLGDTRSRDVIAGVERATRDLLARHQGQEVKGQGDGTFAAFRSARRAIACAIDLQRAIDRMNRSEPSRPVYIRIGLNTGEVMQEDRDLFGAAVTAANRIAAVGGPGDILASEAVRHVLGPGTDVELQDFGEHELKGFPGAWRVLRIPWKQAGDGTLAITEQTPYVGRDAERAELRKLVESACNGEGSLVLIAGEPGIGKTRLTEETTVEATRRGMRTFVGHNEDMEGGSTYAPWWEIVRDVFQALPSDTVRAALDSSAPALVRLWPGLRAQIGGVEEVDLPPDQERLFLQNSVCEFLMRLSKAQPLLLVVEDVHWIDESSLELLARLSHDVSRSHMLVLATYRETEVTARRMIERRLADMRRRRGVRTMALQPIPEAGVEAMLRARTSSDPPPRLISLIYRESEGNPLFVEEVFRHLLGEGKLFTPEGEWRTDVEIADDEVPRSVQLLIEQRLEKVSPECMRALSTAAAIGRSFDYDLLADAIDLSAEELLDGIDGAIEANLVHDESSGADVRYGFAHELVRQTLLSGLSAPRRRLVHLRIAEAMERRYGDSDTHLPELAYHFERGASSGESWSKALEYARRAGERARALYAPEDAVEQFTRAIDAAQRVSSETPALYRARAGAYESLGEFDAARLDFERAVELAHAGGDSIAECGALVELASLWAGRDYARTGESLERALAMARSSGDERLLAETTNRYANWRLNIEQPIEARRLHEEALAIFERLDDRKGVADTLDYLGMANLIGGDSVSSAQVYARAIPHFREIGDRFRLSSALVARGITFINYSGATMVPGVSRDEAIADVEEGIHIGRESGSRSALIFPLWTLAALLTPQGEIRRAREAVGQALEIAHDVEHRQWITASTVTLGALLLDVLDTESARPHLEEALATAREIGSGHWTRNATGVLGMALVRGGHLDDAASLLSACKKPDMGMRTMGERVCWSACVELAIATGDYERALAITDEMLAAEPNAPDDDPLAIPRLAELRGSALAAAGRLDDAIALMDGAIAGYRGYGLECWAAHASVRLAEALLQRNRGDDAGRARALLEDALAVARRSGIERLTREAEGRLERAATS